MVRLALWVLSRAMKNDPMYAWSWHCNLAMMAVDAGASHYEANKREESFMHYLFGVRAQEPKSNIGLSG